MRRGVLLTAFLLSAAVACTASTSSSDGTEPTRGPIDSAPSDGASDGSDVSPAADGSAIRWKFVFKGQVSKDMRRIIKWHMKRATEFFTVPELDLGSEDRYVEVYGEESVYDSEGPFCGQLTEAGGIRLYLLACRQSEADSRIELVMTIAHEVFHAIQERVIDTYDRPPHIFLDGQLPHWFKEGAATWASAVALDEWGLLTYRAFREYAVTSAEKTDASLRTLATGSGWAKGDESQQVFQYGLAFLALELAADKDWESSLQVYADAVSEQVPDWNGAFEKAFGISQTDFYDSFEDFQENDFSES